MSALSYNPICIGDYELDVLPSEQLWRIYDGDRIVVDTRGATFAWERGGAKPRQYLVKALLYHQWVLPPCPHGPLFGEPTDGALTLRGSWARCAATKPHQ